MPSNAITADGITTMTRQEIIDSLDASFLSIYGVDLSTADSSSPDVQLVAVLAQTISDLLDLVVAVYTGMDPDQAIGSTLDQRVAYNGIQRQAGTYSTTNITVTVTDSITLQGLDTFPDDPYTVADNAGNKWVLAETQSPTAGAHIYSFRAQFPGAVLTTPNTIVVPVSVVLGVSSVNNPSAQTFLGVNEETDAVLRVRRQASVSISSQGYLAALEAALANIPGMESVAVTENDDSATDSDGVPGHSIWVVVEGTAAAADIAQVIYEKRNAGCGMFGDQTYVITQADGTVFTVRWDDVASENLYIAFTVTSLNGVVLPNEAAILAGLPDVLIPGVNAQVNINDLATLVQGIDANALVTVTGTSQGFSLTGVAASYHNTLSPSTRKNKFAVDSARISITVTPL